MTNTFLTNALIAKEALAVLENELVLAKLVHRGYEEDFNKNVNGYKPGSSITIRKPARYTLREGNNMAVQDSVEGSTSITVNYQAGVDLGGWTEADRTLSISDFSKRFLSSALKTVAQGIDAKIATLYKDVWNLVGDAGQTVNSFADFAKAPQRLDEMAVPQGDRSAILSPADHWGMVGSFTGLYVSETAKTALQKAKLPMVGGIDTYMTQNTPSHTCGTRTNTTPLTRGTSNTTTWAAAKDTGTMVLSTDGWGNSATIEQGMVFTIDDVYAVNPVSKATLSYKQQFVVREAVTAASSGSNETQLTISPPIITSGAYQTVSAAPGNDKAITVIGTASTAYTQNIAFHKNAFAAVIVPMEKPAGAVDVQRASANGTSVRIIPVYTGSDDTSAWRLDILMGVKAIYPDLATRFQGSS